MKNRSVQRHMPFLQDRYVEEREREPSYYLIMIIWGFSSFKTVVIVAMIPFSIGKALKVHLTDAFQH
jgi:hypothetical protein